MLHCQYFTFFSPHYLKKPLVLVFFGYFPEQELFLFFVCFLGWSQTGDCCKNAADSIYTSPNKLPPNRRNRFRMVQLDTQRFALSGCWNMLKQRGHSSSTQGLISASPAVRDARIGALEPGLRSCSVSRIAPDLHIGRKELILVQGGSTHSWSLLKICHPWILEQINMDYILVPAFAYGELI